MALSIDFTVDYTRTFNFMCPFATIPHYSSHASHVHADIVGGVAIPQGCPEQLGCKMKEIIKCQVATPPHRASQT